MGPVFTFLMWDLASGTFWVWQATSLLLGWQLFYRMSAETCAGARRGSELLTHIQSRECSALHRPHPFSIAAQHSCKWAQLGWASTEHGRGKNWLSTWSCFREFPSNKFTKEDKSLHFCDLLFLKDLGAWGEMWRNLGPFIMVLGFPDSSVGKESTCNAQTWEMQIRSLGWEDPLEDSIATHSNILVRKIPWTAEPGRLQSTELQRVRHDWSEWARTVALESDTSSDFASATY